MSNSNINFREELEKGGLLVVQAKEDPHIPGAAGFSFGVMPRSETGSIDSPLRGPIFATTLAYFIIKDWADSNPGWDPSEMISALKQFFSDEDHPFQKDFGFTSEEMRDHLARSINIMDADWVAESSYIRAVIYDPRSALYALFPMSLFKKDIPDDVPVSLEKLGFAFINPGASYFPRNDGDSMGDGDPEVEVAIMKVPMSHVTNPAKMQKLMEKQMKKWGFKKGPGGKGGPPKK